MKGRQLGSKSGEGWGREELDPRSYLARSPSQAVGCGPPLGLFPWAFLTQAFEGQPLLGDLEIAKAKEKGVLTMTALPQPSSAPRRRPSPTHSVPLGGEPSCLW